MRGEIGYLSENERIENMNVSSTCVIETQGLSKTYKKVQALRSLDLRVPPNSICGFLGPNGAGKTTTIKLLLGLARPTSGDGKVFGLDIVKENGPEPWN